VTKIERQLALCESKIELIKKKEDELTKTLSQQLEDQTKLEVEVKVG